MYQIVVFECGCLFVSRYRCLMWTQQFLETFSVFKKFVLFIYKSLFSVLKNCLDYFFYYFWRDTLRIFWYIANFFMWTSDCKKSLVLLCAQLIPFCCESMISNFICVTFMISVIFAYSIIPQIIPQKIPIKTMCLNLHCFFINKNDQNKLIFLKHFYSQANSTRFLQLCRLTRIVLIRFMIFSI